MIKIRPKLFMITLLFCLCQRFPVMTSQIFIQNFGNYSFVYIYWTDYCFRIHYHSFESYWVVLCAIKKIWRDYHFFLHKFLVFWEIQILITHLWLISMPKIKWVWMGLNDALWHIFPEIDEKLLTSEQISQKKWSNA